MDQSEPRELLVLGPPTDPSVARVTVFSAAAALALVAWDALLTLDDEIIHIWLRPGRAHVKFLYLFARWFGLLNQIGIQIWHYCLAVDSPITLKICEIYFICEAVNFQLLQLCLNAILFLRIRAVYQKRRPYVVVASIIIFFEALTMIMTQAIAVPKSVVDPSCTLVQTPIATTCIAIAMAVSQSVLLYLTYRGKVLMHPAAGRSKIVTVVMRDGMLVFGVVVGIVLMCSLYFLFNLVVVNVFLPWLVVAPSVLTPRVILNLQMAGESTDPRLQLTTELDIFPSSHNDVQLTSIGEAGVFESRDTP